MTFQDVYRTLRRKNRAQYGLLVFCDFVSVLLITSYAAIIRSPTMLNVLPEGGDSRKQLYMIFTLAHCMQQACFSASNPVKWVLLWH